MLVRYHKAISRSKRLQGRPEWQDLLPDTTEGRYAYTIAAKNEQRFSRAFLKAIKDLFTPEIEKEFREAYKTKSITTILNTMPFFREGDQDNIEAWTPFIKSITHAYVKILQEAGSATTQLINRSMRSKLQYTIAKSETLEDAAEAILVDVNPEALTWVKDHSLFMLKDVVGRQSKEVIREILQQAFEKGVRPTEVWKQIQAEAGLDLRWKKAVDNREQHLRASGYSEPEIKKRTEKYRDKLLRKRAERIARTETIEAQAGGRLMAWRNAQTEGVLPAKVERVWLAPPPSPNPNRPCEICTELDGMTAPMNGAYESALAGPISHPPAHPSCRCTETIRRAD